MFSAALGAGENNLQLKKSLNCKSGGSESALEWYHMSVLFLHSCTGHGQRYDGHNGPLT